MPTPQTHAPRLPVGRSPMRAWLIAVILVAALIVVGVWLAFDRGSSGPTWPAGAAGKLGPFQRYTFAGGAAAQIVSPGRFTVLLPVDWSEAVGAIHTKWYWEKPGQGTMVPSGPEAVDAWHRVVIGWSVSTDLAAKGTTLADIRRRYAFQGSRRIWGPETPVERQVEETYLTLPMGKVWRQSLFTDPQGRQWVSSREPTYTRRYWLDRGVVRERSTGAEKQLFSIFTVECGTEAVCRAHTRLLDAIMRSIRFSP